MLHDIPGSHYESEYAAAVAAATVTGYIAVWVAPFRCRVTALQFVSTAALSGADTNSANLNVDFYDVSATTTTEIGAEDYASGTDLAVGPNTIPITASAGYVDMEAGDYLLLEREKVGTGLATPAGYLRVTYQGN